MNLRAARTCLVVLAPATLWASLGASLWATPCAAQAKPGGAQDVTSQSSPKKNSPKPTPPDRQATRLIRFLELPHRRNASIQGLLDLGPRAVPDLGRALADPRIEIVTTAASILRALRSTAVPATSDLERLATSADPTRARVARWALTGIRPRAGFILVPLQQAAQLMRLDIETGKALGPPLKIDKQSFDAELLPNGNFLVTSYQSKLVRELSPDGKVVWKHQSTGSPMDADLLLNGDILLSDMRKNEVTQIDRAGKVQWRVAVKSPYNAERLLNGNTLVASYALQQVIEFDPKGKKVWTHRCERALDAHRLPNGNTLVTSFIPGSVHEVTPAGETRWTIRVAQAYSARMLPNGDVIVSSGKGVYRWTQGGAQKWHAALGTVGSIEIY